MSASRGPLIGARPVAARAGVRGARRRGRRHAAVPALEFDVHVSEPGGRQVYAIALSAQIMIEPARRALRRRDAREAGRAVRRARALGHHDPQPGVAPGRRARARASPGATTFRIPCPCSFDMEVAVAEVPVRAARRRGAAGVQLQRHGLLPRRGRAAADVAGAVGCSAEFRLPVATWRELIEHYYPQTGWVRAARRHARGAAAREGARAACRRSTRASRSCWRARERALEALVDSLLYEGYALYPYTPGATKNATPDAVRDRLPAGLRARRCRARSTTCELQCSSRASGARSRARCASSPRAASATGRSRSGAAGAAATSELRRAVACVARLDAARRSAARRRRGRAAGREPHRAPAGPRPRRRPAPLADLDPPDAARSKGGRFMSPLRRAAATASTPGRCSPRPRTT